MTAPIDMKSRSDATVPLSPLAREGGATDGDGGGVREIMLQQAHRFEDHAA